MISRDRFIQTYCSTKHTGRIGEARAARRNERGERADQRESHCGARKRDGIGGIDLVEKGREQPREHERGGDAQRDAYSNQDGAPAHDLGDHGARALAERHRDAVVAGTPRDVVRDHPVDPDRPEEQRETGEQ